jgi:hypothetical protein
LAFALILICMIGQSYSQNSTAQDNWNKIYEKSNGWAIEANSFDQYIMPTMEVILDGVSYGNAAKIKIYHKSENYSGAPEVAVVYASGYIKLKQNADPTPGIPFGGSFILGPAYNGTNATSGAYEYHNNPQLDRIDIDTSQLPDSPLIMNALGSNHDFNVAYEMMMPTPKDELTRLHVNETYVAKENITINQTAGQKHEGFKLVQFSSMFINEGGSCDQGKTDCHDSNVARYMGQVLTEQSFRNLTLPSYIFKNPAPLTHLWLDLLHTDNESWQGDTPNMRIVLDGLYDGAILVPQGWIQDTNDPNDDCVGLWIHDDGAASANWSKGQVGRIGFWLLAQDNPPAIGNLTASL